MKFKNLLLQNHWANLPKLGRANLTKLGTKHPWGKGIQVCSNEGPCSFSRGDNYKMVKIHWRNLKIFFSRTTEPISTKLGTKHPWMKGIQVYSNEGPRPFPRADNYEIVKIHWQNLKIFFSRTTGPISTKLVTKSLGEEDSSLFKGRVPPFSNGR